MTIGIQGIRIDTLTISKPDEGKPGIKLSGSYALISTTGTILAEQTFNEYSGMKIEPAADTVKQLVQARKLVERDILGVLGLEEQETK